MSTITDKKITDGQRNAVWVQHQQDRLTGTPQQNKAVFDEYSELIREHFNEAMDVIDERIATNDSDIEQLKETDAGEAATSARESASSASESAQTTSELLGRVISISNKRYVKDWDITDEQDEFEFTATDYTYNESDTYEVFVNGLKLESSEFTQVENVVTLNDAISGAGNTVEIIVTTNLKGKGIADTELNDDYTLTINYDDGTSMTTESIRGEKGEKGDKGDGVYDDTEVKADITVLESRVDSFTHLTEGSTTGDAELIDARIGADGTTYANAGDAIRTQVSDIKDVFTVTIDLTTNMISSQWINLASGVGNIVNTTPNSNSAWEYIIYPCKKGDVFTLYGEGGGSSRLWGFTDSAYKLLSVANSSVSYTSSNPLHLKAEQSGYLIVNCNKYGEHSLVVSKVEQYNGSDVKSQVGELTDKLSVTVDLTPKFIGTRRFVLDIGIGNTVDSTPSIFVGYTCIVYPCKEGDLFTLYGEGGSSSRLWGFIDSEYKLLSVANPDVSVPKSSPLALTAGQDGYLIVNSNASYDYGLEVRKPYCGVQEETSYNNTPYIDRVIYSANIENTFLATVDDLPSHPWDNNNDKFSPVTVSEMYALYDAIVAEHPDEMSSQIIGQSSDNQDIKAYFLNPLRPSIPSDDNVKHPKVMVNCSTHGWEKSGTETLLLLLKMMFDHWDEYPVLEVLRWDVDWIIVPITNPYGFNNNVRKNANGVDINRNYSEGWGVRIVDTSESNYQGESPLSEPESQALSTLMHSTTIDIGIDFHDFGESNTGILWTENEKCRPLPVHLSQVFLGKTAHRLTKQFSFLSPIGIDDLTTISTTNAEGKTLNAYYGAGAKFAYTFETCGYMATDPNAKRFNDNHALVCIEGFANFIAQNLLELKRSYYDPFYIID